MIFYNILSKTFLLYIRSCGCPNKQEKLNKSKKKILKPQKEERKNKEKKNPKAKFFI